MKYLFLYLISVFILLFSAHASAGSLEESVAEGNRLYGDGRYDEAAERYQQAKEASPDSDIAGFNLGAALFKKGEYGKSITAFTQSLQTENPRIEADATYNIANAKYKLGSELMNSDLNGAAGLYRESLDYYKRAIELNDRNTDAKYNHELVEKELKILLDKIKNQPPPDQQDDQQDKNEDQKQDSKEDNQESRQTEDGSEDGQEEKDRQQTDKNQQQEGAQDRAKGPEKAPGQDTGQTEQKPEEMSPEEARMLLDAFADEEAMDNLKKMKRGYNREVLKDW